jgi:hypothetical protein
MTIEIPYLFPLIAQPEVSHVLLVPSLLKGNKEIAQGQFGRDGEGFVTGLKLRSGTAARETEGGFCRVALRPHRSLATHSPDGSQ